METKEGSRGNREQTDKSLQGERRRTDNSLSRQFDEAVSETNTTLRTGRRESDEAKQELRSGSDAALQESDGVGSGNRKRAELEDVVREERRVADTAVRDERQRVDASIAKERDSWRATQMELLRRERLVTDAALTFERLQIDAEIERAGRLLVDAQESQKTAQRELEAGQSLLAIVSHDLRSPLSAIAMSAELLAEDAESIDLASGSREVIAIIARNSVAALRLVNDLMDSERIRTGRFEIECETADIAKLARNLVESFRPRAEQKSISIEAEVPMSLQARCDPARITQALTNLLGNAVKFTPSGGSVTLDVARAGNLVRVAVADTGPGIPEVEQQRIFERFSQLSNRDRTGMGLGLYITKSIIEAHGSVLELESTVGKGSRFSFELPLAIS